MSDPTQEEVLTRALDETRDALKWERVAFEERRKRLEYAEERLTEALRQRDEWQAKWSGAIQAWELVSTQLAALKAAIGERSPEPAKVDAVVPPPTFPQSGGGAA